MASAPANLFRGENEGPIRPLDLVPDWGGLRAIEEAERRRAEAESGAERDVGAEWREHREACGAIEEARRDGG